MAVALGAVLCGGASRRMGVDKATLPIDGVAMARRITDALAAGGCSPVVAVGGSADLRITLNIDHVPDEHPGDGPLGGVLTALHSTSGAAVVVSCDIPNIRSESVTRLIEGLGDHQAAIACTEHAEPLFAIWSQSSLPTLHSRFVAGERAMHRAIEGLDVVWVPTPAAELRNVNTPADVERL